MTHIFLKLLCFTFVCKAASVSDHGPRTESEPRKAPHVDDGLFNYCDIECNGTQHTLCKYPAGGGPNCANNLKVYLTTKEKEYIEDNLNRIRNYITTGYDGYPKASNMMKLVWDQELSKIAKRWADQCLEPMHDTCRLTRGEVETGQNVYIGKYKQSSEKKGRKVRMDRIKKILEAWEAEKQFFDKKWINSYDANSSHIHGNFTQDIWATTAWVGCGYTEFDMEDHFMARFVCNFKGKGNIPHAKVYRVGTPCTGCPTRTRCSEIFSGMCWNGKYGDFHEDDDSGSPLGRNVWSLVGHLWTVFATRELLKLFCDVDYL